MYIYIYIYVVKVFNIIKINSLTETTTFDANLYIVLVYDFNCL